MMNSLAVASQLDSAAGADKDVARNGQDDSEAGHQAPGQLQATDILHDHLAGRRNCHGYLRHSGGVDRQH
jgi:hypothetical protein